MKRIKIVTVITLFLISLTGCKKSKEEIEREKKESLKKDVLNSITMVYEMGGGSTFALLVDPENYKKVAWACLDFKPNENRAIIKYYNFPNRYEVRVEAINELEYKLNYSDREASMKLEVTGDYPVKEGSMGFLTSTVSLSFKGDSKVYNDVGRMDLIYGSDSVARSRHGRFKTLEECEAQIAADEELSETLRKQDGACEGPGC
ncbi:lipoprotein, tandem type [Leptospira interrogans]|uniref:lipoprotein, tandem type n=1 Tax=Leptospira interrogans TaxID=173 RepID=UPI00034B3422|nr:lipoprotein, tandem type [Leptospira interrogans]